MQASKNINNLPLPRLEFNWIKAYENGDWENTICWYQLVLPLDKSDIRSESENPEEPFDEWRVDIGSTLSKSSLGKRPINNGEVCIPFRDYPHMQIDNLNLGNLPMYAVCEDVVTVIEKDDFFEKELKKTEA